MSYEVDVQHVVDNDKMIKLRKQGHLSGPPPVATFEAAFDFSSVVASSSSSSKISSAIGMRVSSSEAAFALSSSGIFRPFDDMMEKGLRELGLVIGYYSGRMPGKNGSLRNGPVSLYPATKIVE